MRISWLEFMRQAHSFDSGVVWVSKYFVVIGYDLHYTLYLRDKGAKIIESATLAQLCTDYYIHPTSMGEMYGAFY